MSPIDSAIVALLDLDPPRTTISRLGGGTSSATTAKITTTLSSGAQRHFFLKTGSNRDAKAMFAGEHASLTAISDAVPGLCPRSLGHGRLADTKPHGYFLVTEFLDSVPSLQDTSSADVPAETAAETSAFPSAPAMNLSLAEKLALLHSLPAPIPSHSETPLFGFPITTYCGDSPQDNSYKSSWSEFFIENRLRGITLRARTTQGPTPEIEDLVDELCLEVIPHLLDDERVNRGKGIQPVIVHGDLWSGNFSHGYLPGQKQKGPIIFDASACYAHSEYELGIMRMFGGFDGEFMKEYHEKIPKMEPVEEYDDRVSLYEVYHQINHYSMFGGAGYRGAAVRIMKRLLEKYG